VAVRAWYSFFRRATSTPFSYPLGAARRERGSVIGTATRSPGWCAVTRARRRPNSGLSRTAGVALVDRLGLAFRRCLLAAESPLKRSLTGEIASSGVGS
jgi:hypothetical protein